MSRTAQDVGEFPESIRDQLYIHPGTSGRVADTAARYVFRPFINLWTRAPGVTWPLRLIDDAARLMPMPRETTVAPVCAPHRNAELINASKGLTAAAASHPRWSATRAVLYLHGGAFVACGLNSHRPIAARISQSAGSLVLNLAYRMLPLHPIHDAIDDAVEAYQWLRARGFRDIVIAGDSAGGYLAFMTALALAERGLESPAGIVAMSPLADLDPVRKANHRNADRCPLFSMQAVESFIDHLSQSDAQLRSPVDADLSQMPPVQIHAGSNELLLQDAELMTERLVAAGRSCELHVWNGQLHAFPAASFANRPGLEAVATIGRFIREVTPAMVSSAGVSSAGVPREAVSSAA